jgi:hypothetical protein
VAGGVTNPLTLNRYLYANANPATLVDPEGHRAERQRYDTDDDYESRASGASISGECTDWENNKCIAKDPVSGGGTDKGAGNGAQGPGNGSGDCMDWDNDGNCIAHAGATGQGGNGSWGAGGSDPDVTHCLYSASGDCTLVTDLTPYRAQGICDNYICGSVAAAVDLLASTFFPDGSTHGVCFGFTAYSFGGSAVETCVVRAGNGTWGKITNTVFAGANGITLSGNLSYFSSDAATIADLAGPFVITGPSFGEGISASITFATSQGGSVSVVESSIGFGGNVSSALGLPAVPWTWQTGLEVTKIKCVTSDMAAALLC